MRRLPGDADHNSDRAVLTVTGTLTAVIPCHTPRLVDGSLLRAVASILDQRRPVDAIVVAVDANGDGAAATRQRALDMAFTDWVFFCDADDVWKPNHTETLLGLAAERDADYVYSWFDGNQPFGPTSHRGRQMDPAAPHHTTMTVGCRTDLAKRVGFRPHPDGPPIESAEDWLFTLGCLERGAVFAGTPEITWTYTADGRNTSGLPARWAPDRPQADVTVLMPHIPIRRAEILRALTSIAGSVTVPAAISIAVDHAHAGSAVTRNRALYAATTRWVAPVDDDDEVRPEHFAELFAAAEETGADVVYTGCTPVGPDGLEIPLREEWGRFGMPFDGDLLRQRSYLPVTSLLRTELVHLAGGWRCPPGSPHDDWGLYVELLNAGATFLHVPKLTWIWWHSGYGTPGVPGNTSGDPTRW